MYVQPFSGRLAKKGLMNQASAYKTTKAESFLEKMYVIL